MRNVRSWKVLAGIVAAAAVSGGALQSANAASPGDLLAFSVECTLTHQAKNDPIVYPGQTGASHLHSFFGNNTTDASSTTASLVSGTSNCERGWSNVDRSAYWVPALLRNGVPVEESYQMTAYYRRDGFAGGPAVSPIPLGLRVIAGDMKDTSYNPAYNEFGCKNVAVKSDGKNFPNCPSGVSVNIQKGFPSCWNGKDLDSPDHKSHMAYRTGPDFGCPASHPVKLPTLTVELNLAPFRGPASEYSLASGGAPSMHVDFYNGWDPAAQKAWIAKCMQNNSMSCEGLKRSAISFTPTKFDTTAISADPKQKSAVAGAVVDHSNMPGMGTTPTTTKPAGNTSGSATTTTTMPAMDMPGMEDMPGMSNGSTTSTTPLTTAPTTVVPGDNTTTTTVKSKTKKYKWRHRHHHHNHHHAH